MTVSTAPTPLSYDGNGSTTAFPISWKYNAMSHVVATLRSSTGTETVWALTTNYTLTDPDDTGTLTAVVAPATGETLVITLEPPNTQSSDIPLGGAFPSATVENGLDLAAQRDAKIQALFDRALRVPKTDTVTGSSLELPIDTDRASMFLAFDADGVPIAAAGTSADLGPVSVFINTLLDDTTEAAARTTLGAVGLTGDETVSGNKTLTGNNTHTGTQTFTQAAPFIFEGATADDYETTLAITDPTADQTITVPDATGTTSLADPVVGSAKSLKITNNPTNPNYQLDVTADAVVMENSSSVSLKLATWSVTVDITASGANGLDTGAEANSTWYYIWAIYDGTNKRGLISASATAPTMPAGYTYKALIGAWYNDSGGNLVGGVQFGKEFYYKAGQVVLNAGTATAETSVSLSTVVPPVTVSEVAFLHTYQVGVDAGAGITSTLTLRFITAVDYVTNLLNGTAGGGAASITNEVTIPLVAASYYYLLTNTAGNSHSTTHRLCGFRIK